MRLRISMTVGTTFPRKILNNGKEPCELLRGSVRPWSVGRSVRRSIRPSRVFLPRGNHMETRRFTGKQNLTNLNNQSDKSDKSL